MYILTGSQQQSVRRQGGDYRKWVERKVAERWPGHKVVWSTRPGGRIIRAWINQGNWIAVCPHCPGAQIVEPGIPFYCVDCLMMGNEGYAQKVWFPGERVKIEKILMLRPNPMTRNWLIGETLDQLRIENITHGLGTDLDSKPLFPIRLHKKPKPPVGGAGAILLPATTGRTS